MPVVYSTATSDINYVDYHPGKPTDAAAVVKRSVIIKGGANLATLTGNLITPRGVATVISDDDLAFLETLEAFQRHKSKGFMYVEKGSKPKDADAVAKAHMAPADKSAPLTRDSKDYLAGTTPVVEPTESSKARLK